MNKGIMALFAIVFWLAATVVATAAEVKYAESPPAWASTPQPELPKVAKGGPENAIVPVRPLDDPANPFAGKYDDADRWAYEHYIPYPDQEEVQQYAFNWSDPDFRRQFPQHWMFTTARVDENGWMVPRDLAHEKWSPFDEVKTIREYVEKSWNLSAEMQARMMQRPVKYPYEFWAVGVFPPEVSQRQMEAYYEKEAATSARIPAWLGENPPLLTVFVPGGEIVAYGPLGLQIDDPRNAYNPNYPAGEYWYRYSADGKLLATVKPRADSMGPPGMNDWQDVYADWQALEDNLRSQGILDFQTSHLSGGSRVLVRVDYIPDPERANTTNAKLREMLGAYDYAGNPIALDSAWEKNSGYYGAALHREQVKQMYQSQVKLGLVDPLQKSPYAGTPEGPLVVDPTPRPPTKVAYMQAEVPWHGGGTTQRTVDWIAVRALDDPANPYRGQYGAWDEWLFEQYGKEDPQMRSQMNEQQKRQMQEISKARTEGRKPKISFTGGYSSTGGWKSYQVQVDEHGFPIPYTQQRGPIVKQMLQQSRDVRQTRSYDRYRVKGYHYMAGGMMPDEMAQAYQAALAAAVPGLPRLALPQWLRDNPPYGVIAMPSGEFVTMGALGSWIPGWMNLPREERTGYGGYYRYSASGELLGQTLPDQPGGWEVLYNPNAPSLELSGKSQGYDVQTDRGYLLWRSPKEHGGVVIAAWDYDGTPMPVDQPLTRQPGEMAFAWWESVLGGDFEAMLD